MEDKASNASKHRSTCGTSLSTTPFSAIVTLNTYSLCKMHLYNLAAVNVTTSAGSRTISYFLLLEYALNYYMLKMCVYRYIFSKDEGRCYEHNCTHTHIYVYTHTFTCSHSLLCILGIEYLIFSFIAFIFRLYELSSLEACTGSIAVSCNHKLHAVRQAHQSCS
jgi:hypothetical protein